MWDNCSLALKDKLEKLQNKAARIITGDSYEIRLMLPDPNLVGEL